MFLRSSLAAAVAATALAVPAAAAAQPACVAGSFASYVALGAAGCTIGTARFAGFSYEPTGDAFGNPSRYTGQVTLTPFARAEGAGTVAGFSLRLDAPLTVSATDIGFANPDRVSDFVGVQFAVDAGAGNLIGGLRIGEFTGTAVRSGGPDDPFTSAQVAAEARIFGGSLVPNFFNVSGRAAVHDGCPDTSRLACTSDFSGSVAGRPGQSGTMRLFGDVRIIPGMDFVATGVTYTSTLVGFSGGMYYAPAASVVPEPSTFALAGVGGLALAGVGAARRRRTSTR